MAAATLKAFSVGSKEPALAKGVLRIYGMRFCPYVHRVRLVLAAKDIPYELINIHLKQKPEWFLEKSPEGKVPLLEQDDKLLWESIIISDYLEDVYPQPKLWPADPYEKAHHKIILEASAKLHGHIPKIVTEKSDSCFENLLKDLQVMEKFLQESKSNYFSGDKLGMCDLMLWPHMEVFMAVWKSGIYNGKSFESSDERPLFSEWLQRMQNEPLIRKCTPGKERLGAFFKSIYDGEVADYDMGL